VPTGQFQRCGCIEDEGGKRGSANEEENGAGIVANRIDPVGGGDDGQSTQ
jgi:hypothetical protein